MAALAGRLVAFVGLIWAGMSIGIVHDAGVKFSTPEVPRTKLLRVGMHLFRSYRRVETALVGIVGAAEAQRIIQACREGRGLKCQINKPLLVALAVSTVHSHVFPMPALLAGGDHTIERHEQGEAVDPEKVSLVPLAHKVVGLTELTKIGCLIWGAHVALKMAG
uniref:DUF4149 domain-containing protein n=2 Tax=Alexandrium andersonii TaxID=327968 RepID=A0A7S2NKW6_9DINO